MPGDPFQRTEKPAVEDALLGALRADVDRLSAKANDVWKSRALLAESELQEAKARIGKLEKVVEILQDALPCLESDDVQYHPETGDPQYPVKACKDLRRALAVCDTWREDHA